MYQWMSNAYGPTGWFSETEVKRLKNDPSFSSKKGSWRKLSSEEEESFRQWIGKLTYEQS